MGVGNYFAMDSMDRVQRKYFDLPQIMKGATMNNVPSE
jgi:hypothetical protein